MKKRLQQEDESREGTGRGCSKGFSGKRGGAGKAHLHAAGALRQRTRRRSTFTPRHVYMQATAMPIQQRHSRCCRCAAGIAAAHDRRSLSSQCTISCGCHFAVTRSLTRAVLALVAVMLSCPSCGRLRQPQQAQRALTCPCRGGGGGATRARCGRWRSSNPSRSPGGARWGGRGWRRVCGVCVWPGGGGGGLAGRPRAGCGDPSRQTVALGSQRQGRQAG